MLVDGYIFMNPSKIVFSAKNNLGSAKNTKSWKIKLSIEKSKNPKDTHRKIFSGFW